MKHLVPATLLALCATASADAPQRPKLLVLPLPPTAAVDAGLARTFDARLLVALDDTKRVTTVTSEEESECTTLRCLADLAAAADAAQVLSLSIVKEPEGLTVFGNIVDAKSATVVRRVELPRVTAAALAKSAPTEIVPQIVGAPTGPVIVGVSRPVSADALSAALAVTDRMTALRQFRVASLDGSDRSGLTHRAELVISDLHVDDRRHVTCTWHEGTLVGTFTITELATGKVVFTKTATITEQRRAHFTTRQELVDIMLANAVNDWMSAFEHSNVPQQLAKRR